MKATTSVQMSQQLHLTPQLLQSIRLLQLDAQQLQMEITRVLEQNPMLELDEENATVAADGENDAADADSAGLETAAFDELPEPSMWDVPSAGWSGEGEDRMQRIAEPGSSDPFVRVLERLSLELDPKSLEIAGFWLEHCDDAGYLDGDHSALLLRACARFDVAAERIEAIRQHLLHGEPAGLAARDAGECLRAQLAALPSPCAGRPLAARILEHCLAELAAHDHAAIARRLEAEAGDVAEAVGLILSLQPRPAQAEADPADAGYVIPDVVVWHGGGQWRVALNPATAPKLNVNAGYERALAQAGDGEGAGRLRELLQEARWLTRGLSMRYDTLLRTAKVIVERQAAFLERGDEAMAPLTLKEVADAIGMHESTVSRITSGKYVQTPRGTFELKHFFAVRLEGASVSGAAVRAMVRRLIESEPASRPLADDAIAALLARQGVNIARRTVAKYREQLSIAPARERRRGAVPPTPALASAG
ncbi:RNA polymerase sigma-54 factor [Pseudoxanthomonas broegbernensis]|uniref:RNA polymerase sigma-54 factor n=1 Tax=Pseudoxanthomonas broegbernensis TaxID=83619 RepID=A0A7V8GL76_9GAMM|nr:RNA polymerase factor sigma-54 [Pseudoxanthomonas broegbernensis]KAF1685593.1 RNA polymerase sigma-54 factor [Pseudoxanthomonas broegbernensis]MBB6065967.1 RNA polymerase sigma-54 factor [Pseudoxanthomonas broegbernensis]